jgi:hypothetical protein
MWHFIFHKICPSTSSTNFQIYRYYWSAFRVSMFQHHKNMCAKCKTSPVCSLNLTSPSGIDPATFRFVAQCLNHCATAFYPALCSQDSAVYRYKWQILVSSRSVNALSLLHLPTDGGASNKRTGRPRAVNKTKKQEKMLLTKYSLNVTTKKAFLTTWGIFLSSLEFKTRCV